MTHEQSQKEWALRIAAYAWAAERARGSRSIELRAERLIEKYKEFDANKTASQGELAL